MLDNEFVFTLAASSFALYRFSFGFFAFNVTNNMGLQVFTGTAVVWINY
jgi:hypothetical protein